MSILARLSRRSRSTTPLLVCEGTIALCCVLPVEKHHTLFCSFIAFFVQLYFSNSTRQIMVIKNEVAFSWILFAVSTGHGVWFFFGVWDKKKIVCGTRKKSKRTATIYSAATVIHF